ncbi:uncharacterized protein N7496_002032 [Penicillium cataractarum]|uniref:Uncharacterized protein n=1 Tax=Penicillium cataractarum TaxID=2100454 RepID=A0A9X0B7E9_9EURO|nr:uncharacterized protein N7496_002032 [Penicillium cataractarum]KAJ5390964.1 hypothetical protein N7496_002032 [Penicillium cataractarum]
MDDPGITMPLVTSSLLDQLVEFEFPLLQPFRYSSTTPARFHSDGPIIREGSPIGFDLDVAETKDSATVEDSHQANPLETEKSFGLSQRKENVLPAKPPPSVVNPYNQWLRWTMNRPGVFNSPEEEALAAQFGASRHDLYKGVSDNSFFQWGLRYMPKSGDENAFRTVLIENLPDTVTLDQILTRIRGGAILSASLTDTRTITGSPTALIIFLHNRGALNFLYRVAREGFYIGFSPAQVRPVPTPTYRTATDLENQIRRLGHSRCLVVRTPYIKEIRDEVHRVLSQSRLRHYVECFGERDLKGEVTVQFHSIKIATVAYLVLVRDPKFKGQFVKFGPDPCAMF